ISVRMTYDGPRRPTWGEAGVDRFHIVHVLNHRSLTHSTVTAIYNRYRYDKETRAALEKWARCSLGSWKSSRRRRQRQPGGHYVTTCTSSSRRLDSVPRRPSTY